MNTDKCKLRSLRLINGDGSEINIDTSKIDYLVIHAMDILDERFPFVLRFNDLEYSNLNKFISEQRYSTGILIDFMDGRSFAGSIFSWRYLLVDGNVDDARPYAKHHRMAREICRGE